MDEKVVKWYVDAYLATQDILSFVEEMSLDSYATDQKTKNAVERSFEIIGEALNRIRNLDENLLQPINEHHAIIGFRNHLAHGYDQVDNNLVWSLIVIKLPSLVHDIRSIPEVKYEIQSLNS